ncbi:hypothetical protein Moror_1894 [Moniliophthora roreri MCA 2997]|uniref:Uncharacterized protein n=1 Tax=Moniliophthora roreri (strain MCA 2997) TaxID=1381753 RepID=V2X1J7_MONRO|nr:hypothetical protein Moror_1894 [Moniliophthora roreri MCA 2997]
MLSATKPEDGYRSQQGSSSSTQHRVPRKQPSYNQVSLPIGPISSHSPTSTRDTRERERSISNTSSTLQKLPYDDMKRLLSKPATVSGYTSGGASASDSEGYSSRQPGSKYRRTSDAAATKHASSWVAPWDTGTVSGGEHLPAGKRKMSQPEILVSPKGFGLLGRSPSLVRIIKSDDSEGEDMGRGKEKEKKPRNVLRRKPSSTSNRPGSRPTSPVSTPTASPFFNSPIGSSSTPYTPLLSIPLSTNAATLSPLSFSHSQATTLRPPGSGSRVNSPSPSRGASSRSSSRSGHSPLRSALRQGGDGDSVQGHTQALTPAEEIMLAYQRQAERQQAIEKSFEEAERKAELRAAEERRQSDEKRRQKVLRDAELQRGKEIMSMRRGDTHESRPVKAPSRKPSHEPDQVLSDPETSRRTKDLPTISGNRETSPPPTPYYTVFGSSTGKVATAGDSDGSDLQFSWTSPNLGQNFVSDLGADLSLSGAKDGGKAGSDKWERRATVTVGNSKTSKDGFGRTLSRKMSTKFGRKEEVTSMGTITTESYDVEVRGRPSLQERRKRNLVLSPPPEAESPYSGLRLSIDRPHTTKSPKVNPVQSVKGGAQTIETDFPGPQSASQSSSGPGSNSSPSPMSASTTGGKNKIWNLMKRISTGGLRDKYHDPSRNGSPSSANSPQPPPVPALPKGVSTTKKLPADVGITASIGSVETSHSSKSLRTRRSLTNLTRPGTASSSQRGTGTSGITTAANSSTSSVAGSASVRPSTTTRSSSPFSSSETSKYFNPPRSARSSTSSYGEEIPPLPPSASSSNVKVNQTKTPPLQQHIIPPSELSKLQLNFEKERDAQVQERKSRPSFSTVKTSSSMDSPSSYARSNDTSRQLRNEDFQIVSTPAEEKPGFSLPVPPSQRREKDIRSHSMSEDLRPGSPSIPQFSTSGAINTWTKRSSPNGDDQPRGRSSSMTTSPSRPLAAPAPPLPTRSPRRPSLAKSPSTAPVPETSRSYTSHSTSPSQSAVPTVTRPMLDDLVIPSRKSTSALPNRSVSAGTTPSHRATMIFREMPKRSYTEHLTEKQKADKWDALLQKSAQAGGTLHLSGNDTDRLESDELRFSVADGDSD